MKKATSSLLFLCFLLSFNHLASQDQLPSKTWRVIERTHTSDHRKWENDVQVMLRGNFTPHDSILVINALEELNQVTETIRIGMSPYDRGNLELFFIDSMNARDYDGIIIPDKSIYSNVNVRRKAGKTIVRTVDVGIRIKEIPDSIHQHFITSILSYTLYPLSNTFYPFNPYYLIDSIFNYKELLKEVYSADYDEKLALVSEQVKRIYWPHWLRDYSHALLIWPLILILFLFAGLFVVLYRKVFIRIKHPFLRFNVGSLLGLLVFGFFLSLFFGLGYRLVESSVSGFSWLSIFIGTLITIGIGLPAVNIFRLVEVYISRKTSHKYLKSLMLFLSVSLIPSVTLFMIIYFSGEQWKERGPLLFLLAIFLICTVIGIIRALINFFVLSEKELRAENELQVSRLRELKTKAELNALHSKINPHFLYNALNSIAGLSKISAEKTEYMALMLSKLFRHSINREQTDWSALGEEINIVNIYLEIEKVRFDDRLEYSVDLPDELTQEAVPRFIIQPLVENAIKHGISQLVDKGVVKVKAHKSDEWLEIAVEDNGPDFPDDLIPGFGLQGIYDKLEILYPNRFELHFHNSPQKQIVLKLS